MILTKIVEFGKLTKILQEKNIHISSSKNTTKIAIKILQSSAFTQNMLQRLVIHNLFANFL